MIRTLNERNQVQNFYCGVSKTLLTINLGEVPNQMALDVVWGRIVGTVATEVAAEVNKLVVKPLPGGNPDNFSLVTTKRSHTAKGQSIDLSIRLTGCKGGIETELAKIINILFPAAYVLLDEYNKAVAQIDEEAAWQIEQETVKSPKFAALSL